MAPWSSRCQSGRARHQRPSRCVRPPSRHTARGSGPTPYTAASMLALPMGGWGAAVCRLQQSMNRPTGPLLQWACLMAEAPPALATAALPRQRGPRPGGPYGLWAQTQTLDKTSQKTRTSHNSGTPEQIRQHPNSPSHLITPRPATNPPNRPTARGPHCPPLIMKVGCPKARRNRPPRHPKA